VDFSDKKLDGRPARTRVIRSSFTFIPKIKLHEDLRREAEEEEEKENPTYRDSNAVLELGEG
jgi:hypothetical protein